MLNNLKNLFEEIKNALEEELDERKKTGNDKIFVTKPLEIDDEQLEKEAAQALISGGCVLISQHADSMGAPTACETAGVPNVSYNGSTVAACPNTFIVSSRIDWTPYFKYMIQCVMDGKAIDTDWTGTIETGSVVLTDVNEKVAAEGTVAKLEEVKAKLLDGTINVFDTANFTVNGERVNIPSYLVKPGDVIAVHGSACDKIKENVELNSARPVPMWMSFDANDMKVTFNRLPERNEIDLDVEEQLIVELYSK